MVNSLPASPPPEVLISFRDFDEALPVLGEPIAVFDLKEPMRGALGRPDRDTVLRFGEEMKKQVSARKSLGSIELSVAIGEAFENRHEFAELVASDEWRAALAPYDYVKTGLSNARNFSDWEQRWIDVFQQFASFTQLVPVAYADWMNCNAPSIDDVLEMAIKTQQSASGHDNKPFAMLIDTFDKTAGGLFSHLQPAELLEWNLRADRQGVRIGVAGSLSLADLARLRFAKTDLIGLRGAVCDRGQRTNRVDIRLVREFLFGVKRPQEDK